MEENRKASNTLRTTGSRRFGALALILWLGMLGFAISFVVRRPDPGSVTFLIVSFCLVVWFSGQLARRRR